MFVATTATQGVYLCGEWRGIYLFITGYRVGVPFGKNKLYTGLVYKKHQVAPQTYTPNAIEVILDEYPLVHAQQLAFWNGWATTVHYGQYFRTFSLSILLTSETTVTKQEDAEVHWDELSDEAFLVMEALEKVICWSRISGQCNENIILPSFMVLLKWVCANSSIAEEKYTPKYHRYFRLHPDHQSEVKLNQLFDQLKRAPKQSELLLALLQLQEEDQEWVKLSRLKQRLQLSSGLLRTLVKKGIFEERFVQEDRPLLPQREQQQCLELSLAQLTAFENIKKGWEKKGVVLLEGVTSSGKRGVFLFNRRPLLWANKYCFWQKYPSLRRWSNVCSVVLANKWPFSFKIFYPRKAEVWKLFYIKVKGTHCFSLICDFSAI